MKDWRTKSTAYAEWNTEQFPARIIQMEDPTRITKNTYYIIEYKFWMNIGSFRATGEYPKAFCNSQAEARKFITASTKKSAPKNWEDFREMAAAEGFIIEKHSLKKSQYKIEKMII